jgi:hypothetical protein
VRPGSRSVGDPKAGGHGRRSCYAAGVAVVLWRGTARAKWPAAAAVAFVAVCLGLLVRPSGDRGEETVQLGGLIVEDVQGVVAVDADAEHANGQQVFRSELEGGLQAVPASAEPVDVCA